ncbi:MAG: hypothetical protein IPJ74_05020 [Saprospiraceae bacterium]|nr:hypothetical protein [Saprospiraceae bacterium]
MKTLNIVISEGDFDKYGFSTERLSFEELIAKINNELARQALLRAQEIAEQTGLSQMTLEEINAEIQAVRDAKNHS